MKKLAILLLALSFVFCLSLAVNAVCSADRDLGDFNMVEKYYGDAPVNDLVTGELIGGYKPGGDNSFSAIFDNKTDNTGWAGGPAPREWNANFNITLFYAKSYLIEEFTVFYVTRGEGHGYTIEISNDGGATWQEIGRYEAPADFAKDTVVKTAFTVNNGEGMMGNAIRFKWIKGYSNFNVTFTEIDIKGSEIFECQWDEGKVTTQETCGDDGVRTYTCTKCGGKRTEVIPADGMHDWNEGEVTLAPTETSSGTKLYTCLFCGDTRVEILPAVGHAWDNGVVVAPDCENGGYTLFTCTDNGCGATYKDFFVDKLGHSYNDGVETKHPTLNAEGVMTFSCTRTGCDSSYTETLPVATITDSAFVVGADNIISFTEYISSGLDHELRDYNKLFDGIKVNASNSQSAPGGWFAPAKSTLTIVLDEEYFVLSLEFYAWSNYNSATFECFDGSGQKVVHFTKNDIQEMGGLPIAIDGAAGKYIKTIKITVNSAKGWEGYGNCLDFQEFVITAHKHKSDEETSRYDEVIGCTENGSYKKYCYVCEKEVTVETPALGEHILNSDVQFANGLDRVGTVDQSCERCNYEYKARIQPVFSSYGYSVREVGGAAVVHKYEVNLESLEIYNGTLAKGADFGIVAAATPNFEGSPLVIVEGAVAKANDKVAFKSFTGTGYVCFEYAISNIPEAAYNTSFVLCAYVYDGEKIVYINANDDSGEAFETVSYNDLIS